MVDESCDACNLAKNRRHSGADCIAGRTRNDEIESVCWHPARFRHECSDRRARMHTCAAPCYIAAVFLRDIPMLTPVILSGGSGTRLWPLSRKNLPKQFLALNGSSTLFQQTIGRARALADVEAPIVVCSEDHRFLVAEQLRALQVEGASILLEPMPRNTARQSRWQHGKRSQPIP